MLKTPAHPPRGRVCEWRKATASTLCEDCHTEAVRLFFLELQLLAADEHQAAILLD